jgi:hypothetical protein
MMKLPMLVFWAVNCYSIWAFQNVSTGTKPPPVILTEEGRYTCWISSSMLDYQPGKTELSIRGRKYKDIPISRLMMTVVEKAINNKNKGLKKDGCHTFSKSGADALPDDSLADALSQSETVFAGEVISIDHGFLNGLPRTLLTLDIKRWLRNSGLTDEEILYLSHNEGRFTVGDLFFCGQQDQRFEPYYAVFPGQRFLVIHQGNLHDEMNRLIYGNRYRIITESPEGQWILPRHLVGDPNFKGVAHFDDAVEAVLARIQKGTPPNRKELKEVKQ